MSVAKEGKVFSHQLSADQKLITNDQQSIKNDQLQMVSDKLLFWLKLLTKWLRINEKWLKCLIGQTNFIDQLHKWKKFQLKMTNTKKYFCSYIMPAKTFIERSAELKY